MATRYAGKYPRSPYSQATRTKNILTSNDTYHWGDVLAPPGQIVFLCWGDTSPPSPPTLLSVLDADSTKHRKKIHSEII